MGSRFSHQYVIAPTCHSIRDVAARCILDARSADSCPLLHSRDSGIFARNTTDATGRVLIETKPYGIARFHHGAWVGMSILAAVLLILCALLAGLTLGVCGLDSTLLQLRCITGTPRERYDTNLGARGQESNKDQGDKLAWSLG